MNRLDRKRRFFRPLVLATLATVSAFASSADLLAENAHPAVVRVIAPDRGGVSLGSGSLVAVSGSHGVVVTNWHVVRDAAGPIMVVFPDGFRSGAAVMKIDRDWDLAALAIWRPRAKAIPLAAQAPQYGDVLTIAGYGQGQYRTMMGRCVQYVSPGTKFRREMVELSTTARQGDSGGPILNSRGELAGVLFGSSLGRTTGSYCGRVRSFLEEPLAMLQRLPPNPAMIAQTQSPEPVTATPPTPQTTKPEPRESAVSAPQPTQGDLVRLPRYEQPVPRPRVSPQRRELEVFPPEGGETAITAAVPSDPPAKLPTRGEQIKTILAVIGLLALLFHGLRFLAAAAS